MAKPDNGENRRIHLQIRERHCPGLITFLDRVPEGEVNAFIRNVLVHWFEVHEGQGNLDQAISKILLYDALRIAREHMDAGSDIVGTYSTANVVSTSHAGISQPPAQIGSGSIKVVRQILNFAPASSMERPPARTPPMHGTTSSPQTRATASAAQDAILFDPDDLLNGDL